jgi:Stress up-regulated Nod 19
MTQRLAVRGGALVGIAAASLVLSGCLSFYHSNVPWSGGSVNDPVTTETFRIGPYNLAPMNQPGWEVKGNQVMPRPAGNVAIKEIDFTVVDGDGNPVGLHMVHLHHIVLIDTSQPDAICPSGGARFAGTGAERTVMRLRGDYAYKVDASDVWRSTFHIHTTSDMPANDVYIQYTVKYEPITAESAFKYTTPYFLDVTGCWSNSGSLYDVPGGGGPGSEHIAQKTYTARRDGIAVWAGGHIHAGGIDISLTRDATGEDYCTATASYAPGGHPNHPRLGQLQRISDCQLHSEVKAGETFTLRSRYDNEYPVPKSMGIMLAHVHEPGP